MHRVLQPTLTAITDNTTSIGTNTTAIADNTTAINERVKIVDIVDDLTTGGTMLPLSAEQGKVLKNLVDTTVNILVDDDLNIYQHNQCFISKPRKRIKRNHRY